VDQRSRQMLNMGKERIRKIYRSGNRSDYLRELYFTSKGEIAGDKLEKWSILIFNISRC
jgi:hypothetical protein